MRKSILKIKGLVICYLLLFYSCAAFSVASVSKYAIDSSSSVILEENATTQRVPASILKIISSYLAIDKWGGDHRFETDFFLLDGWLWVKGKGDPFFVSEEMDLFIVDLLNQYPELSELKGIGIDGSYFSDTKVDGRDGKNDPYNAPLSAVATNFNTVFIKKQGNQVVSAESQTPLAPVVLRLARKLSDGKHRINLVDRATSETYFAELLRAKLLEVGVKVGDSVQRAQVPADAKLLLTHKNSRLLSDVLRGALEYSNNFISNMLFVQLCHKRSDAVEQKKGHTMIDAQTCAESLLHLTYPNIFIRGAGDQGWKVVDGAGLSRQNRLNAKQMVAMLAIFAPYKHLLKTYHHGRVHAKTGTLNGVRTFAGYAGTDCGDVRFAFFFEGEKVYGKREQALEQLIRKIDKKTNNICN